MNKTLLTLSTLLLLSFNSYSVEIKEIDSVQLKNGLAYEKGQETPFTGTYLKKNDDKGNKFFTESYIDGVLISINTWYEDGSKFSEAEYKNGKINGYLKSWHKNGKLSANSNIKNNKEHGVTTKYYKNGNKKSEGLYDNGKMLEVTHWDEDKDKTVNVKYNGLLNPITMTKWHKNGQKKGVAHYKNRMKHGIFILWHENGNKKSETNFVNDKWNGLKTTWRENGIVKSETNYSDNIMNGLSTTYFSNGSKEFERHMKNNKTVSYTMWDKDGNKVLEVDMSKK
ncbi:MAG TPA: hypothetical protein EYQ06_01125 [Flavobacteriales bacterium]|jgi:antitoxin component YwqK of YwqJK toxin-antitoxin module|nr:hypothetical protein [Flavobacteriales bacterium]